MGSTNITLRGRHKLADHVVEQVGGDRRYPAATSTGEFQMNLDTQLSAAAAYAAIAFVGAIVLGVL